MKAENFKAKAKVIANGKPVEISQPCTVTDFLASRGLKPTQVVVEYNGEALVRGDFGKVELKGGDRVEIVLPVAGG